MTFNISHWFTTDMAVRGEIVDMTKLDGFVVYDKETIIGLITYKIKGNECEIMSLDSLKENQGIGTALVNKVIEIAREKKCRKIELITTNDNINAIGFYQKRGFEMSNLYCNALEISRKLKPSIPLMGNFNIPLKHEIEFKMDLASTRFKNHQIKKPIVITVAAVSGGGKTTIINELNRILPLSKCIYFDDYDFEECPKDFFEWVQSGADYNAWNVEKLADDIEILLVENNLNYILLDYPFAYKNHKVAPYIDYAIFIDTPLDISMSRRILRDMINKPSNLLEEDLKYYLYGGRLAYLKMIKTIKPDSDFIVDGSLSINDIVHQIIKQIPKFDEC